jgi:hypothetical protein
MWSQQYPITEDVMNLEQQVGTVIIVLAGILAILLILRWVGMR